MSLAQVADLPDVTIPSIIIQDTVDNILDALDQGLDGRIEAFDLVNGTEITFTASQFRSLQTYEQDVLGGRQLLGPFKVQGVINENVDERALIADILDDQDSRFNLVSSADFKLSQSIDTDGNVSVVDRLALTFNQLIELGDD